MIFDCYTPRKMPLGRQFTQDLIQAIDQKIGIVFADAHRRLDAQGVPLEAPLCQSSAEVRKTSAGRHLSVRRWFYSCDNSSRSQH
jgi:hypothetical protein